MLSVHRAEWEAADPSERGPFEPDLDGAGIFEQEEDLLGVIDMPRVLPLLSQCLGEDLQIRQVQTRYNPGGDPAELAPGRSSPGVGGWHRDRSNYHNNATGRSMWLKVFIYFYDVTEDGGATALVPQTHLSDLHPRVLPADVKDPMPGMIKAAGKAGTALLFVSLATIWHRLTFMEREVHLSEVRC